MNLLSPNYNFIKFTNKNNLLNEIESNNFLSQSINQTCNIEK